MKKVIMGIAIGLLILITGVYAGTLLKASDVSYNETTVKDSLDTLFEESANGKAKIAEAITNKGVETSSTDSYEIMVENISKIKTGIYQLYEKSVNQGNGSSTVTIAVLSKGYIAGNCGAKHSEGAYGGISILLNGTVIATANANGSVEKTAAISRRAVEDGDVLSYKVWMSGATVNTVARYSISNTLD